jgi:hypothetical protein
LPKKKTKLTQAVGWCSSVWCWVYSFGWLYQLVVCTKSSSSDSQSVNSMDRRSSAWTWRPSKFKREETEFLFFPKLICKVTLSFTPYPLFQWYSQSKEISFNLKMKYWCTRLKINYSSCTGKSSEEEMKLSLPPKLMEKLVWVPVIWFCEISFLVTHLMPYYDGTHCSRPLIAWLYR